jgi:hypothetical protein
MWQNEMTMVLRYMIGDSDDTAYKYCDEKLQEILLVAGCQVGAEINFAQTYTIRPLTYTIIPDPTADSTRDDDFIVLVCLKAAAIITTGEYKVAAFQTIYFKDRDTVFDNRIKADAISATLRAFLAQYEQAKWEYQLQKRSVGRAILGSLNLPRDYDAHYRHTN